MATLSGPSYRRLIYGLHKHFQRKLEVSREPYLSENDLHNCSITELAPLSWEPSDSAEGPLFSEPMPKTEFDRMTLEQDLALKAEWKKLVKKGDPRCAFRKYSYDPWLTSENLALDWGPNRCDVAEAMACFLREQLKTGWCSSKSLLTNGGWRALTDRERRDYRGYLRGVWLEYRTPYVFHPSDQTSHNNRAWCVVAEQMPEFGIEPQDDKLLRSELCVALRIARNRIKRDKTYKSALYPVMILSISLFHIRLLQIHIDPARKAVVLRKTPYILIDSRSSDNVKLVLRWWVGRQVGDTRRHQTDEVESDQDLTGTGHPVKQHLEVPSIIITTA